MNTNLAAVAPAEHSSLSLPPDARRAEDKDACSGKLQASSSLVMRGRQSGRLHPRLAPYLAFLAAVFVSLVAAATVASHDVPLMLGGL